MKTKIEILKNNIERINNNKLIYKGGFNLLRKKAEEYKRKYDLVDIELMGDIRRVFIEGHKEQIKNNKEFYEEHKINPRKYNPEAVSPEQNGIVKAGKKSLFNRVCAVFRV